MIFFTADDKSSNLITWFWVNLFDKKSQKYPITNMTEQIKNDIEDEFWTLLKYL